MACGFQPQMRDCWGKIPRSAQKLKMKSYLFLLSLLGDGGGGELVPRGCARGNFHVPVFQCPSCKHKNPRAHPQPTCQRCSPGDPRGWGNSQWGPPSAAAPLAEPQTPRMRLLHGNSLPKGCGARKEAIQEKLQPNPWQGVLGQEHLPCFYPSAERVGAELSAEACW